VTLNVKLLALDQIQLSEDLQLRDGLNDDAVKDYADRLDAKTLLPPLTVVHDGSRHWLVDGFHRYHAAKRSGLVEFHCDVREGSKQDAEWLSCSVNARHGLRRTNEEKKRAILKALAHPHSSGLTVREIAAHVGCHFTTVADYRANLNAVVVGNLQNTERELESTPSESEPIVVDQAPLESLPVRSEEPVSSALSAFADNRADKVSVKPGKLPHQRMKDAIEEFGRFSRTIDHLRRESGLDPHYFFCRSRMKDISQELDRWAKAIKDAT
jgi:ParB-like chromosome segregation protein Spo0J